MKRISKKDLNKRALSGARVVSIQKQKPVVEDNSAELGAIRSRQDADFTALSEAIVKTNEGLHDMYGEVMRLRNNGGMAVQLKISRGMGRLIEYVDIVKTRRDGSEKHTRATFLRDNRGDVSSIDIQPR